MLPPVRRGHLPAPVTAPPELQHLRGHFYYMWIDNGSMIRVKQLCGYRIKSDLNLNELDTEWKVHPCHK